MIVEIDDKSGFCFGVVRAITEAERALAEGGTVYSLGDIVHNRIEVQRLERLGLRTVTHADMPHLAGCRLFIRAHGEPPTTYAAARAMGIGIIDATCPVVARLLRRVKEFSGRFDAVVFVCGRKSSNGKGLSEVCRRANPRTYVVEEASEIDPAWFEGAATVGICGATSTPKWLMQEVADHIENGKMKV